jgi:signal transduction histidine kinase
VRIEGSHVRQPGRYFLRYSAAIILTAAALVLRLAFNPILRSQLPFITFYPAVIASAWYFGRGPGFASAVLASAAALTVFYPPVDLPAHNAQLAGILLFLLFACALVLLVDTALRARDRAARSEAEVRTLNAGLSARVRDFETLLHVTPVALLVAEDRECKDVRMNAAASALIGVAPGANVPYKITRDGVELPPESLPLQTAAREGVVIQGEAFEIRRADGEIRQIVSGGAPLRDEHGNVRGSVAALVDVTVLKQMEAESARRARDLARSSDDLRQFAYAASHDLQEPLRTVIIYAQLLDRRFGKVLDGDGRTFLDFVTGGAKRLEQLLNDLQEYWRVGAAAESPAQPVDSAAALARALANLSVSLEASGARVAAGEMPPVMAHEIALVQLFQNLLGNAIKYRSDAPPLIEVKGEKKGRFCEFEVKDNGRGIEPRHHETIFEIFRRLEHGLGSGSGIGLALCRKIVERYDGRIWVESVPGEGSTFRFWLPARES